MLCELIHKSDNKGKKWITEKNTLKIIIHK